MKVSLNKRILSKNEEFAEHNKAFFADKGIACVNVISSPGSGKTTLLARTIRDLAGRLKTAVVEGDIKTDTDARKIRETGAQAVQIETDGACHLSANQVSDALKRIDAAGQDIVFIENVGNLVCPSDFYLGENKRVVLLSVPEGDDKPVKYPATFARADVVIISKMDLIDYIEFDIDRVVEDVRKVNPDVEIFQVSASTGDGMSRWYDWLTALAKTVAQE